MLCGVAAFCRLLRPVLKLVLFPRSQILVVGVLEGAETHRALHHVHRTRQSMQRFSAMYNLLEGGQGHGENTLKWGMHDHHFPPDNAPKVCFTHAHQ